MVGDVLKVFHFIAAVRREKRYMYKFVRGSESHPHGVMLQVGHLDGTDGYYWLKCDGRVMSDVEIVQGSAGMKDGDDYRDRPRLKQNAKMRDGQ